MKYDKILNYVPHFDKGCLQGRWRCCGTGVDVMGIIGILLLLGGVVQMGAGTYFMIVLPIFDSASNIWTGAITGLVGAVFMYYGCTNQSHRRHYINLSLSLLALVTNIANLVIIVVGERGSFLSEEDKLQIDRESKNNLYTIAIWGTASTSCTIILILFMVAQFIFCGYLQPRSSKNKPVSQFPQSQSNDRFFSPSRVINSKHSSYLIPTLDDMIHPHASPNAAWVYNGDDKLHGGFYPMGFESHPSSLESGRRPAARHSSFAATPRYAQVMHRPQRAKSFASSRDPFSLHGISYSRSPTGQIPLSTHVKRYTGGHVRRSSSMNSYHDVAATLSKKYRAISSRPSEAAVIEVGSLISEISEQSLADALVDIRSPIRVEKINKPASAKTTSERSSNRGTYSSKSSSTKGPAPQPPMPKPLESKNVRSVNRNKKNFMYYSPKEYTREDVLNMDDVSEEFCNCKSEEEEEICIARVERRFDNKIKQIKDHKQEDVSEKETLRISNTPKNRLEVSNQDQNSTEKQKIANHDDFIGALKAYLTSSTFSDKATWTKLEEVLMEVLSQNMEQKHDIGKKVQSQRTTSTETVDGILDKPIVEISENKTPKDVQKNKIILRVPSFKNTSCQTEYYRPVRKKSFAPSHLQKLSPNKPSAWNNDIDVQVNLASSSSSGYSSPEAESKESSPIHSGPPSPTSPSSCDSGPNITIIEINRSDISNKDIFNPPTAALSPPKPFRMKNIPRNNLPTIHSTPAYPEPANLPLEKTSYSTQTHDPVRDTLLTEAVNPALIQRTEPINYAPRIIDVVHKNRVSRHDTFSAETGRQRNANMRTNSLSLPRVSYAHPNRPRLHRSESRSPSPPKQIAKLGPHPAMDKPQSTAAYLASLELLASHYRQQALANAKQLQMQRTMLEQRKKSEIIRKTSESDSAWLPQTIDQS